MVSTGRLVPAVVPRGDEQRLACALPNGRANASLSANFLWSLAGTLVFAGCQWGMLVALTKLGDAEMVGQFALALAITAPVFMFTNLQLRGIQATDARREYAFGDYLSLRLAMTALGLTVVTGFALLTGYTLATAAVIA